MRKLIPIVALLLMICVNCIAEPNVQSFLVATNMTDFARCMEINQQRTLKGLVPLPIRLSPELDEKLAADAARRSHEDEPQSVVLRFVNTPLSFVLEEYTALTGMKVVTEGRLPPAVSLDTEHAVSQYAAARLIEEALLYKGIVLEPVDAKTLRAVMKSNEKEAHRDRSSPSRGRPSHPTGRTDRVSGESAAQEQD